MKQGGEGRYLELGGEVGVEVGELAPTDVVVGGGVEDGVAAARLGEGGGEVGEGGGGGGDGGDDGAVQRLGGEGVVGGDEGGVGGEEGGGMGSFIHRNRPEGTTHTTGSQGGEPAVRSRRIHSQEPPGGHNTSFIHRSAATAEFDGKDPRGVRGRRQRHRFHPRHPPYAYSPLHPALVAQKVRKAWLPMVCTLLVP